MSKHTTKHAAKYIAAVFLLLLAGLSHAALVVGVPPIHSMRTLAARYEPLRAYLESQMGEPVYLESALNFSEYHARTVRGEFDLVVTPAHFARLAQKDQGFVPIIQFQPDHDALLIYGSDQPLTNPGLMKGQQLAVIDHMAVTVLAALHYLGEKGLESGQDYRVVEYRNHASVGQAITSGQAMAGVSTTHGMKQIPERIRSKLKVYAHIADIPAFVMLAKSSMPKKDVEALQRTILAFARSSQGKAFLKSIAYSAFVPASEQSLHRVDAYLEETRKGLSQ